MNLNVSSTCPTCGAVYSSAIGLRGDIGETLAALDRMHDDEHPECPPRATDGEATR